MKTTIHFQREPEEQCATYFDTAKQLPQAKALLLKGIDSPSIQREWIKIYSEALDKILDGGGGDE